MSWVPTALPLPLNLPEDNYSKNSCFMHFFHKPSSVSQPHPCLQAVRRWHYSYFLTFSCPSSPAVLKETSHLFSDLNYFSPLSSPLSYKEHSLPILGFLWTFPLMIWESFPPRLKFKGLTLLSFLKQGAAFSLIPSANPSISCPTTVGPQTLAVTCSSLLFSQEIRIHPKPGGPQICSFTWASVPSYWDLFFLLQPQHHSFWQKRCI